MAKVTRDHPLAGVWAKVERAKKHILDFKQIGKDFLDSDPFTLRHKAYPNTGKSIIYIGEIKEVPIGLTLCIGDAIHNLRSSLDLLACQLVRLNSVNNPCSDIYFPIADNSQKLETTLGRAKIQLLGQSAIQIIRRLEPYQGGKRNELWQLHRLDIQDKHRLLIIALAGFRDFSIDAFRDSESKPTSKSIKRRIFDVDFAKRGDLWIPEKGAPLSVYPTHTMLDMKGNFTIDIAFNEPKIVKTKFVFDTLIALVHIVEDTIKQFEPFFG